MREFAYQQAMAGVKIPGMKLVAKRPKREWKENVNLEQAFKTVGLTGDDITVTTTKLLSPAQIEANAAFESEYAEGEAERYRQENVWWRKVLNFILRK